MNKLTKKYKVVHEGTKMVFPLTEEGDNAEVFPSVNATAVEFDSYEEAQAYVDANGLEYKQSEQLSILNFDYIAWGFIASRFFAYTNWLE